MNILTFDTATEACTVALQCGDAVYFRHEIAPQKHASLLLPLIQSLIDEASITLPDLTAIGFGCGPGSFMGVRLATGIAQGLGFGLNIPLIPISTLQTIAQTAFYLTETQSFLAGWDARMNEIYWGFYVLDENRLMQSKMNDQLSAPEAVDTSFAGEIGSLAGNAWAAYQNRLPKALADTPSLTTIYPEAKAMLPIAISQYLAGNVVAAECAHPHYVRHHVVNHHN
jgi:tRNA threonylcarbamoyladenosine biosynthesis protein TsaB